MKRNQCKNCKTFIPNKMLYCNRCSEEINLKIQNKNLKENNEILRTKVIQQEKLALEYKNKLDKKEEKTKFPIWIKIQEGSWSCTNEYLEKLLKSIAPVADTIKVEWGRNDTK